MIRNSGAGLGDLCSSLKVLLGVSEVQEQVAGLGSAGPRRRQAVDWTVLRRWQTEVLERAESVELHMQDLTF